MDATYKHLIPTQAEVDEFVGIAVQNAKDRLADHPEELWPDLLISVHSDPLGRATRQVEAFLFAGGFRGEQHKYDLMRHVGRHLYWRQLVPAIVVLTSETWVVRTPKDQPLGCQPMDHPDRRECVMIAAMALGRQARAGWVGPIRRDAGGGMHVDDWDPLGGMVENRMIAAVFAGFFETVARKAGLTI